MKNQYKLLSSFYCYCNCNNFSALTSYATEKTVSDNIFLFGSYSQSEVKDSELLMQIRAMQSANPLLIHSRSKI